MSEDLAQAMDEQHVIGCTRPLRVLTYNVKGGEGADGRYQGVGGERDYLALEHVASLIKSLAPDLVALQEIAVVGSRGRVADQVAHLAARLGMNCAFGPVEGGPLLRCGVLGLDYWGNAILTRLPLISFRVHELAFGRPRDCRSILEARIRCGSQVITFASLHLSYIWRTNFGQSREFAALVAQTPGPYVAAGDFNASAGSAELTPVHAILRDGFTALGVPFGHPQRHTFPAGSRRERDLDHVFVSADVRVERCTVYVDEDGVSDHNPVLAELWLPVPGELERAGAETPADERFA